jgi:hypothetical protein
MINDNSLSKKILCNNILSYNICKYGTNCIYAHSLEEQYIMDDRKYIIELIISNKKLNNINLLDNRLLDSLLIFTKLCYNCIEKKCVGGYNCKYGACGIHCCICYEDFIYGTCQKIKCNFIHLTYRNLVPYITQKKNAKKKFSEYKSHDYICTNLFKLCINNTSTSSDSDSYENEDVQTIIEYIHN